MDKIYSDGTYARLNPSWHREDSPWKASQIAQMILANKLDLSTVAEVGCGSGIVLKELQGKLPENIQFFGFDISEDAIARTEKIERVHYSCEDFLGKEGAYDLLLVIDVVEHVADYLAFLEKCRQKARFKLYHIPLDIHVSSVARASFIRGRKTLGHIHYFTAETALASLSDTGHKVIDMAYTDGAVALAKLHPGWKRRLANVPRRLVALLSRRLAARWLGGYSLLILTE